MAYLDAVRDFLATVTTRLSRVRQHYGLFDAKERPAEWHENLDLTFGAPG